MKPRTQTSVAVSADGNAWTLLNASPDLRAQLAATPALQPRGQSRSSPIAAVILTGAEVDQTAGLLSMRERQPFALYGTPETLRVLGDNPMFNVLSPDMVSRQAVPGDQSFLLPGGIEVTVFAVPGKVPLYLEGTNPETAALTNANVGIEVHADGARIAYVPGCAAVTPGLQQRFSSADVLLFDGTLFTDDEMIRTGTGDKTGRRMGHMPVGGQSGSLAALTKVGARRIYVHINNTNPILIDGSPERRVVEEAGWSVAEDGLEIVL